MKAEETSSIINKKSQTAFKRKLSDTTLNSDNSIINNITKQPKVERKSLVRTEIFGNTTLLPTTISYNSPILPDAIFLTTSSGQLITTTISPPTPQSNILQEKHDITLQQQHQHLPNLITEKDVVEDVNPTITRSLNENTKSNLQQQQQQKNIEEERRGAAAIMNKNKKKNKKKKTKPSATQPSYPTSTTTSTTRTADDSTTTYSKTKKRTTTNNITSNKANKKKKKLSNNTPTAFTPLNGTIPAIPSDCLSNGFLSTPLTSIAGIIEQVKVARARNELSLTTSLLPQLPASLPPPLSPQLPSPTAKYIDTSTFLKTEEEQRRDNPHTPTLPTPTTNNNNNNNNNNDNDNNDLTTVATQQPTSPTPQLVTTASTSGLPTATFVVTNDHLNTKETSLNIQPQNSFPGPATTAFANFPLITSGLTGFAQANFTTFSLQAPLLTPGLTIPLYNSLLTVSAAKDGVLPSLNKELFPVSTPVGNTNIVSSKKTKSSSKKKSNNNLVNSQQNGGSDMTTSRGRKRTAQSRLPAKLKEPAAVARRNARERRRVKMVNDGFLRLRRHVPTDPKNKKLSKVKTLRLAIEYIHHLQTLLQSDSTTKQTTQSIVTSFTAQMSNYDDLDDETAEWLQPDSLVSFNYLLLFLFFVF